MQKAQNFQKNLNYLRMFMDKAIEKKLINYGEAIYEACYQEMETNPNVFVYGLGVDDPKGHYGTTKNLHEKFGPKRCQF